MGKVKAADIREKSRADLLSQVDELKKELSQLRVAQVTGGAASKLAKIKLVRKNIARVLTVLNQKVKAGLRKSVAGLKHKPKELREKKTRALRRALTPQQAAKKTVRAAKKAANFPLRRYALKA